MVCTRSIAKGPMGAFQKFALVVVDGFADFTRTQHEILSLLHTRHGRVVHLLAMGRLPRRFVSQIAEHARRACAALPGLVRQTVPRRPSVAGKSFSSTLCHIERTLFAIRGRSTPLSGPRAWKSSRRRAGQARSSCSRHDQAAAGRGRGRRMHRTGTARRRFGRVSFDKRSSRFGSRDLFRVWHSIGDRLWRRPRASTRYLGIDRGAGLAIEDWPFRRLLQVVLSNHFRPQWPDWRNGGRYCRLNNRSAAYRFPGARRHF